MARSLIAALKHAGAEVTQASDLCTRDGAGDIEAQNRLITQALATLPEVIAAGGNAGWQAWVTYHSYYKAPDLLGPAAAKALNIPYLQIEATRARKRLSGPWARFAQAAEDACDRADAIFFLTQRDAEALRRDAPTGQDLIHLPPFLNIATLPSQSSADGPMLSVGMMRDGDKLASYQIIADTLALLQGDGWQLHIAGDGPARADVAALMAPFGDQVTFLGSLDTARLSQAYQSASLLFWPGVNEAFGMTYLEAQAAGLPVVAQHRPGVCDVLAPDTYPTPEQGPSALAERLTYLSANRDARRAKGHAARDYVGEHHLLATATAVLRAGLAKQGVAL